VVSITMRNRAFIVFVVLAILMLVFACVFVFFDQAVFVRRGTFYHANVSDKVVALTFDDGPSAEWTPKILDALKGSGAKATFFMIGEHVVRYPEIARRVVAEGHEAAIHTFHHPNLLFSSLPDLKKEIVDGQRAIKNATNVTTNLFRPPKAWLTNKEKKYIDKLGFISVLWTLNSKDWVTFDDKYVVKFLLNRVRPGDIILFHDAGGVFGIEKGDRDETLRTIPTLVEKLKNLGYRFVTVSELIKLSKENDLKK
jgi:peptidoglycan/xylan/chitin deacetylase (PgdA/CDA1 family)